MKGQVGILAGTPEKIACVKETVRGLLLWAFWCESPYWHHHQAWEEQMCCFPPHLVAFSQRQPHPAFHVRNVSEYTVFALAFLSWLPCCLLTTPMICITSDDRIFYQTNLIEIKANNWQDVCVTLHITVFEHITLSFLVSHQSLCQFFLFHNYEILGNKKKGFFWCNLF